MMDHRIAGIKANHETFGGIEFNYSAQIKSGVGQAPVDKRKGKHARSSVRNDVERALTEPDQAGTGLCEYSPFVESLSGLHPKQALNNTSRNFTATKVAFGREKISG